MQVFERGGFQAEGTANGKTLRPDVPSCLSWQEGQYGCSKVNNREYRRSTERPSHIGSYDKNFGFYYDKDEGANEAFVQG